MRKVALTGLAGSGKSTVTEILENRFHYRRADFTGLLKRVYAEHTGIPVVDLEARKEEFRADLQSFASQEGFDTHPRWIIQALDECGWLGDTTSPVVFDNVRTPEQAMIVSALGLGVVRIAISRLEASIRLGCTDLSFMGHPVDRGLDSRYVWREVNGYNTPEYIARTILELPGLPTMRFPDRGKDSYSIQALCGVLD